MNQIYHTTTMNQIHSTAIVGSNVKLGKNIYIGPYTVLEGDIEIGDNCRIGPSVHIMGWVKIGKGNEIHSFAVIGDTPQDYSFSGARGLIEIGENCKIREGVTIHTPVHGTEEGKTIIGNQVFLMSNAHVGHNSKVGDCSVIANGSLLAGHVEVEDHAVISGNVAIHQFCRIGSYSIIGGCGKAVQDVPPYVMASGNPLVAHGLNIVGLRRNKFPPDQRNRIKDTFKIFFSKKARNESIPLIESKYPDDPIINKFTQFIKQSKRGVISRNCDA